MNDRADWTPAALQGEGFVGWVTFEELGGRLPRVSSGAGVYVVVRDSAADPEFLGANPGGRFKGRDPTVGLDALRANWVGDATVLYIGKADNLRRRLRQYMRYGEGVPVGHWGGRLIWQLADARDLLVGWRETPGRIPKEVETRLIAAFRRAYDKPPFCK